tara:strand:- start:771 stop:1322 length:552 start_codon:yes stop_codon:yes gene_type:complete
MLDPKDIGKIRKRLGMTQNQLSEISGVSQSLIAKIEATKVDPTYRTVKKISDSIDKEKLKRSVKINQVMTKKIYLVKSKETLKSTIKLMTDNGISQLPIIHNKTQVGSITDKKIMELIEKSGNVEKLKKSIIGDLMEDPFPVVSSESPIEVTYNLLEFYQAIIVIKKGEIVGIVTKADVLKLQ